MKLKSLIILAYLQQVLSDDLLPLSAGCGVITVYGNAQLKCESGLEAGPGGMPRPRISYMNLDLHLGITPDEEFDVGGTSGISGKASNISIINTQRLQVSLPSFKIIYLDLDQFIRVDNNTLEMSFNKTSRNIRNSGGAFALRTIVDDNKTVTNLSWTGILLDNYGREQPFEYDLHPHLAQSLIISAYPNQGDPYLDDEDPWTLVGYPMSEVGSEYRFYLDETFANVNGKLVYEPPGEGFFEKNGEGAKFVEGLPVLGYLAAYLHAKSGNDQQALRAIAKCNYATAVAVTATVTSVLGGGLVVVGAATVYATIAGIAVEQEIRNNWMVDGKVKEDIPPATLGRVAKESVINAMGGTITGVYSNHILKRTAHPVLKNCGLLTQQTLKVAQKTADEAVGFGPNNMVIALGVSFYDEFVKSVTNNQVTFNDTAPFEPTEEWLRAWTRNIIGANLKVREVKIPPKGETVNVPSDLKGKIPSSPGFTIDAGDPGDTPHFIEGTNIPTSDNPSAIVVSDNPPAQRKFIAMNPAQSSKKGKKGKKTSSDASTFSTFTTANAATAADASTTTGFSTKTKGKKPKKTKSKKPKKTKSAA
ncbi:hypothetical protein AA313_de0202704 [Arthrobotrys entomopaga]|nr:hypothetical protein AA313_de0202704 [Arthrobotrys entomopaga]